jgi:hypothetical protein
MVLKLFHDIEYEIELEGESPISLYEGSINLIAKPDKGSQKKRKKEKKTIDQYP